MREYEREIVFILVGIMVYLVTLYIDMNKLNPLYWFNAVQLGIALNMMYRLIVKRRREQIIEQQNNESQQTD